MPTLNSYLTVIAESVQNAISTESKYYYFFNKNVVIRISDHISTKYIDDKNALQIIIPNNQKEINYNRPLYNVFYGGVVNIYNFSEVKSFINTFIFMQKSLCHTKTQQQKVKNEIKIKNKNSDSKILSNLSNLSKTEILYWLNKFSVKQRAKVIEIVIRDMNKQFPEAFSNILIFDDIFKLNIAKLKILIKHSKIVVYINQNIHNQEIKNQLKCNK